MNKTVEQAQAKRIAALERALLQIFREVEDDYPPTNADIRAIIQDCEVLEECDGCGSFVDPSALVQVLARKADQFGPAEYDQYCEHCRQTADDYADDERVR